MTKFRLLFILFFTLDSVMSGYYETKRIYYQKIEPLETLEQKYFNVFSSNPYRPIQTANDNLYLQQYNTSLTDISRRCPKNAFFASYNPTHRGVVARLTNIFKNQREIGSLLDFAQFVKTRPEIHPQVWFASIVRAQASQMPETLSMQRPSPINLFPTSFFPTKMLNQGLTEQQCVRLDERIGQDNGIENLLWYFREDIQMNAHHWIWHLLYPLSTSQPIDRRGEFFYFFHHELIARYGAERIANDLLPQKPLNLQVDTTVAEGYNPHLRDGISSSNWASRQPFAHMSSLNSTLFEDLINLTIHKDRLLESLFTGSIFRGDVNVPIHTIDNVNILGEVSEASNHSINPKFYGEFGYHGQGHFVFANLVGNSPPGEQGVMGDFATAMRDPIFYRWHKLVDILFLAYKATHLAPYNLNTGEHPLVLNGLSVTNVKIVPHHSRGAFNLLHTYWSTRRFNVEGGIDFNSLNISTTNPVNPNVCAKHLDHEEFTYHIKITNSRPNSTLTTVRIFMAPRYRTRNEKTRYTMAEQRGIFFMMDSFQVVVPPGNNLITRRSEDSTVTAPWPKSIEQIRQEINSGIRRRTDCECGYPHHLLLPKGTERGMTFDLFVMLTDGVADKVVDNTPQPQTPNIQQCEPSHVHCGIQGRRYPDAKPMGYPFDRIPYSIPTLGNHPYGKAIKNVPVKKLEDYIRHIPNAFATQIIIRHQNVELGF